MRGFFWKGCHHASRHKPWGERGGFFLFPRELARTVVVGVRNSGPLPDSQEKDESDGGYLEISTPSVLWPDTGQAREGNVGQGQPESCPRGLLPGRREQDTRVHDSSHQLGPLTPSSRWGHVPFDSAGRSQSPHGKQGPVPMSTPPSPVPAHPLQRHLHAEVGEEPGYCHAD